MPFAVGDNSTSASRVTKFKAFFGGLKYANTTENTTSTWAKTGILTPPAVTVEVGSSNLELQLRASAFTIQSLGPSAYRSHCPPPRPSPSPQFHAG